MASRIEDYALIGDTETAALVGRDDALTFTAGPDALCLQGDIEVRGEGLTTVGDFNLAAGERRALTLTWFPSHEPPPGPRDAHDALRATEEWWRAWSGQCKYDGP